MVQLLIVKRLKELFNDLLIRFYFVVLSFIHFVKSAITTGEKVC